MACGTVSSNVMEPLAERNPGLPLFGVIDAACDRAAALAKTGRIAVAATEATVRSGAFERALRARCPEAALFSKPCQSLVSMAEQGHFSADDPLARAAVETELAAVKARRPEVLLLACTHFPLFREAIAAYMGPATALLSVGEETACALAAALKDKDALADRTESTRRWFTSGPTDDFERLGAIFLGHSITAEQHINQEIP